MGDRRVARTRAALEGALLELILEEGFEAITVSGVTERANVGRSTFYAHYADKEDLLQGAMEGLREHLARAVTGGDADRGPLGFCLPMLEHAQEMRPLFMAMTGRPGAGLLEELAHDIWADFVREHLPEPDEIAAQAIAGAFGATLRWWLSRAPDLSPAEVDRRFRARFA